LLSIVIVHWNTPRLLDACLASIERERRHNPPIEKLLVVDCASADDAHQAVISSYSSAELLQMTANRGYAAGCNTGAQAAGGEVILFLNADTEVLEGSLGEMLNAFALAPHIGMVAPLLVNVDGSIQSCGYRFPGVANALCDLLPAPGRMVGSSLNGRFGPGNGIHPYTVDYALGAAIAVRRTALESTGGFDECYGMYCEELDLARRLQARGWTRLVAPAARVTHVGGASTKQIPDAMRSALWRSRGRYHRIWDSRARQRTLSRSIRLACALRRASDRRDRGERWRSISAAFEAGLRCTA
jgi:hypothetical protein